MPRTWLEVSLDRIALNYRMIQRTAGSGIETMPVVKADAYRHGATAVSQVLEREGAKWLAVSNIEEGKALRDAGIRTRILVMADRVDSDANAWSQARLTPVIHDLREIATLHPDVSYHLKIDSGMARLGTNESAETIIAAVRGTRIEGLMTHYASSANFESEQTKSQQQYFEGIRLALEEAGIRPHYLHQASTNPLHFGLRQSWGNLARPGYAIYGFVSRPQGKAPTELLDVVPALSWKAKILLTKEIPAGAPVGYGAQFVADKPMKIGILGVGYADGLPHRLGNRGQVIAAGKYARILGAVSMDVTTVDLTGTPQLNAGDSVTLLGSEGEVSIDARQMAREAGTIAYSILCGISTRVPRHYV
ncbi:alanine racemase [Bryobacter aggregatus]|uniref:alanine racemase n=1 Tax=Bryobacter aggregatus TaxID=360054 RepID=UPI0004E0D3A1|nr:alanine racemase [Bryobacter aggregatus]